MALLSAGTTLTLDDQALQFCASVPSLGGSSETVDVTALEDSQTKSIAGLKEFDELEFTFWYDTVQFKTVHPLCDGKTEHTIAVTFPDGLKAKLTGTLTIALTGAEVGEALQYTITIFLSKDLEITLPTA